MVYFLLFLMKSYISEITDAAIHLEYVSFLEFNMTEIILDMFCLLCQLHFLVWSSSNICELKEKTRGNIYFYKKLSLTREKNPSQFDVTYMNYSN